MVTFFTGHLPKSELVLGDEIFTFHIYVELNTHSPFPGYAGLSYDSPLLTTLVQCFDIK